MSPSTQKCLEWCKSSTVKIPAENGKSAIFTSSKGQKILLVHADRNCRNRRAGSTDGIFNENQKVADYIISKPKTVDVIVELKGTDIIAAVDQIEATIPLWQAHIHCSGKIGALIVSGKGGSHPRVISKLLVKQEQLKKRGIKLRHSTDPNGTYEFAAFI